MIDHPNDTREQLRAAVWRTARRYPDAPLPRRPEDVLERLLREEIHHGGIPNELIRARNIYVDRDWWPLPGGIDLYVNRPSNRGARVVCELKVRKVEETLWDALKMVAALGRHQAEPVEVAALVVIADAASWQGAECRELFEVADGADNVLDTTELVLRNHAAWSWLLSQGSARPTMAPARIATRGLVRASVGFGGYELRAIEVRPHGDERIAFTANGWPQGCGIDRDCSGGTARLPGRSSGTVDCAGYAVPRRLPGSGTDTWLRNHVPKMSPEQLVAFVAVLRGRGWTQDEREKRVLPHAARTARLAAGAPSPNHGLVVTSWWPRCDNMRGRSRDLPRVDAFWIECLTDAGRRQLAAVETSVASTGRRETELGWYLVARDLSAIVRMWPTYPFSHMWNAYSPFHPIKPVYLTSLEELAQLHPDQG